MKKLSTNQIIVGIIILIVVIVGAVYLLKGNSNSMGVIGKNISTDSNVEIVDTQIGTGKEAVNGSHVFVHYKGTLDNGAVFDESYSRGKPIDFDLGSGRVIRGWEVGLQGMKVGGKRHLVIQPDYAYGTQAIGGIPPNAVLTFDVELVDVQ